MFSFLDSASTDISNNVGSEALSKNETQSTGCQQNKPIALTFDSVTNKPAYTDGFEDTCDSEDEQWWIDDNMNKTDPWKSVNVEPMFQYPVFENQYLFDDLNE